MPLSFTGDEAPMEFGISFRAEDERGKQVAVHVSQEALDDYDRSLIKQIASDKYDAGKTEANGIKGRGSHYGPQVTPTLHRDSIRLCFPARESR